MERLQATEELREKNERSGGADLLIGVASPVVVEELAAASRTVFESLVSDTPSLRCVIAYPQAAASHSPNEAAQEGTSGLRFMPYSLPPGEPSAVPWLGGAAAFKAIEIIAGSVGVRACVIVAPDLAVMDAPGIQSLIDPIFEDRSDVCMPVYATGPLEDLLNNSILSPLTRALYGRRIRFPIAPDFGVSARMLGALAEVAESSIPAARNALVWPTVEAVRTDTRLSQAYVAVRHGAQNEGLDLSAVLGGLLGSLFGEMEKNASIWQRLRGSQAVPLLGKPSALPTNSDPVNVRSVLDSFQLGARNLQEVWSLILPPVTLLELKHLTRLSSDQFRMPDDLWVRIVYDFALAHRLRTISRSHILGALTPLYLGWVASYVLEVGTARLSSAEPRLESLAQAYEAGKPYLLSRWRWPDRFNP